jgi:hypothetical protein
MRLRCREGEGEFPRALAIPRPHLGINGWRQNRIGTAEADALQVGFYDEMDLVRS